MKMFVIGDEDTVLGFRYCGIDGKAVTSAQEALALIEEFVARKAEVIVILPDHLAVPIQDRVNEIRFEKEMPILVEIPGPQGPSPDRPALVKIIQQAIGIHM